MYYISFQNLIQEYVVPSSITCVNSMEVSYIPIAKARGFTTHWIITETIHETFIIVPRILLFSYIFVDHFSMQNCSACHFYQIQV